MGTRIVSYKSAKCMGRDASCGTCSTLSTPLTCNGLHGYHRLCHTQAFFFSLHLQHVMSSSARENLSNSSRINQYDLEHPFAEGAFRLVAKGWYEGGPRNRQPCVWKWSEAEPNGGAETNTQLRPR